MLNLGKIEHILKLLFVVNLLFFSSILSAFVDISAEQTEITRGDQVRIQITVSGKNIKFPALTKLGGYEIESQSQSHSKQMINGYVKESYQLYFLISPKQDTKIDPINIEIDGQIETTKELFIKVKEPKYNPNDPFTLRIVANKTRAFVGEPILITVEYKEDESQEVVDRKYSPPSGDNLWLKTQSEISTVKKSKYSFTSISYIFTPQQAGKLTIDSASMKIGMRQTRKDSWGFFFESVKWTNVISNALNLEVLPIPKNAKIVGDFKINASVDKTEVESNEAVNLTIDINGTGNIEDIPEFDFKLDKAIFYKEKPNIEHKIENNQYLGTFQQKIAIIPNQSLEIPSFKVTYFSPQDLAIYTISTEPIKVKLKATNKLSNNDFYVEKAQDLNTTNNEIKGEVNPLFLMLSFILGVFLTLIIIFNPFKYFQNLIKNRSLLRTNRTVLKTLLPFVSKNSLIFEVANKISFKLYTNKDVELNKKEIKQAVKTAQNSAKIER